MADSLTYDNLESPYNSMLERTSSVVGSSNLSDITNSIDDSGSISTGDQLENLTIATWIRSRNYKPKSQGFLIDGKKGYIEAMQLYVGSGGITGGLLDIPDTVTENSFHVEADGDTYWGTTPVLWALDNANADAYVLSTGQARFQNIALDTNVTISGLQSGTEIAILGWQNSCIFTATNYNTVSWTAGAITLTNGVEYTLDAGDTGGIGELTYIYLNTGVSETELQTTIVASTAVGSGKILVAVAEPNADDAKKAIFQVFGGSGGMGPLITADNIAANSITANEIAVNTITANEIATGTITADKLAFSIVENNIASLDDVPDGTFYSRVLKTDISAGHIKLSETIGSLDNIANGTTYSKVLTTDIQSGHIKLSETIGTLDDIDNGTYGKVLTTSISAGKIVLTSGTGVTGVLPSAYTQATVGATWGTNLSGIPRPLNAPSGSGLYLSTSNLGYYDGGSWRTYMDSSGNFYLGGTGGSLRWNAGSNSLYISGQIVMTSGSISWASITAPAYTQVTGTKPPTDATNGATLGVNVSGGSSSTNYINGSGYMTTITANSITTGTINANLIEVGSLDASKITSGSITSTEITSSILQVTAIGASQAKVGGSTCVSGNHTLTVEGDINVTGTLSLNSTVSNYEYFTAYSGNIAYATRLQHEFWQNGSLKHILDENLWSVGDTYAYGTKNFLIDHPDGSGRLLKYSSQESPEVILRHRGKAETDKNGNVEIIPPKHFTLVTESSGDVTVNLTPIGNNTVYLKGEPTNGSIKVSSNKPNVSFHYEIIAIRSGFLNSPVEIDDDEKMMNRMGSLLNREQTLDDKLKENARKEWDNKNDVLEKRGGNRLPYPKELELNN